MKRKKMIGWLAGIPFLVVILVIIIRIGEPTENGITRASACKAAALSIATVEQCLQQSEENSFFPVSGQKQWYVKYMDWLYHQGWLNQELTPATEESAESFLTYAEADYLAGQISETLRKQVGLTKRNHSKPYPQDAWWKLYRNICKEQETWQEDGKVREETLLVYGTFEDVEDEVPWRAYTSEGTRGFEGLGLSACRDKEIKVLVSGSEILRIIEKISDSVVYKNIWISGAEEKNLTAYISSLTRNLPIKTRLKNPEEMINQVADIYLNDGKVSKIVLKKERVSGKVLEVREDSIELEGYGQVPLDKEFKVYRLYGEFKRQSISSILVGSDVQEFVVADGQLCAALTMHPFNAETIRVLIMNTGFHSIFHDSITLELLSPGIMITGDTEESFQAGDVLTFKSGDPRLAKDRVVLKPTDETAGIRVSTLSRGEGKKTPVYPGHLEIKQEDDGLVLVNDLYLEDYLKRVVPSEMPASYQQEALKAQAVCARTYAWKQIMANGYKNYGAHVDDSTKYQVYNNTETNSATDTAVNETYGKMVTYNGQVAEIYYFSTSCGHTTDGTVWGASQSDYPYLKGVAVKEGGGTLDLTDNAVFTEYIKSCPDAFESGYNLYRWTTKLTNRQLQKKVTGIGTITKVTMKERSTGGIGKVLLIEGTEGSKEIRGEGQIRAILGNSELVIQPQSGSSITGWSSLPSAFVAIECSQPDENQVVTFTIYGGGYGHGVGMSQNGAQAMAKAGKNYKQILEFFYVGTEIAEIDEIS